MKSLHRYFEIAEVHRECLEDKLWRSGFDERYSGGQFKSVQMDLPFLKDSEDFL